MKHLVFSHSYQKDRRRRIKHLLFFFIILIFCSACSKTNASSPTSISIFEQQPDATAQQAPIASQEYSVYTNRNGVMGRFDAQRTGNNPYEHTISTQNLSQLHPIWSYRAGNPLGMVSANGMVYIGYAQNVDALDEKNGKVLWQYQAPDDSIFGTNQSPIVVVNETIYIALSEKARLCNTPPIHRSAPARDGYLNRLDRCVALSTPPVADPGLRLSLRSHWLPGRWLA